MNERTNKAAGNLPAMILALTHLYLVFFFHCSTYPSEVPPRNRFVNVEFDG